MTARQVLVSDTLWQQQMSGAYNAAWRVARKYGVTDSQMCDEIARAVLDYARERVTALVADIPDK